MYKPPHLPIPPPLHNIHQTPYTLLRTSRPILLPIRLTQITHRKPRIIRKNLNPRSPIPIIHPVLNMQARRQHVHRYFASAVWLCLDLVHGRCGRETPADRASARGYVDYAGVCAFLQK